MDRLRKIKVPGGHGIQPEFNDGDARRESLRQKRNLAIPIKIVLDLSLIHI